MHCVFMCALVYNMMCVACYVHLCVIGYVWKRRNTRVGKHNFRGLENNNEPKNSEIEWSRISGWQLTPLRKIGMNGLVHDG